MYEVKIKANTETLTVYVQGDEELHRILHHYLSRGYVVAVRCTSGV